MSKRWLCGSIAFLLALAACSSGKTASPGTATPAGSPSSSASTASGPSATTLSVSAALTGLTGRLLFSRFIESTHTWAKTYSVHPDGSGETTIPLPGPEGGGRWSRSGAEIAVMTEPPGGQVGTAIIKPDGTVLRTFTPPGTLNLSCTVWSPDGSRLACEGWDDSDNTAAGIYSVRSADGADLKRLTTTPAGLNDLAGDFAPDGSVLLFKRSAGEGNGPLMVVDVAGGSPRQLGTDLVEDTGRFSPDGSTIATSAYGALLILTATGTVTQRISGNGAFLFGPDWSPDGKWIAYSRSPDGPFADIFISHPDGSQQQQVTHTPDNEIAISWGR